MPNNTNYQSCLSRLSWRDAFIAILSVGLAYLFWQAVPASADQQPAGAPIGTGFHYQGRLTSSGFTVDEACDFRFGLFDDEAAGIQFGSTQEMTNVPVEAGLFDVMLNDSGEFGTNAFTGSVGWLNIEVSCPTGSGNYVVLTPRQQLAAVPYALGLRSGARISGTNSTILTVEQTSTSGAGLYVSNLSNSQYGLRVVNNSASGSAASVEKRGGTGVGQWTRNLGATGSGSAGYSANWYGAYGYTGATNHNYGLYSPDNLFTRNVQSTGPTMIVARNRSGERLVAGSIVAFSGVYFPSELEGDPIVEIGLASRLPEAMVAGVVYSDFDPIHLNAPPEGVIASEEVTGEYVLIVIQGPAEVQVNQFANGVTAGQPLSLQGDLLTSSNRAVDGRVVGVTLATDEESSWIFVNP